MATGDGSGHEDGMHAAVAVARPGTRAHLLTHRLMFPTLVRCSQFAE
jgi:hypothetical protein